MGLTLLVVAAVWFASQYRPRSDIVFLMDSTRSMTPFIDTLKQNCIDFAEIVSREGHDCRLGLVGFGDVECIERTVLGV